MSTPQSCIDLLVPQRREDVKHQDRWVSITKTSPIDHRCWYDEGAVIWTLAGVPVLDGSFSIYPNEQLEAVVSIVEHALHRREHVVNIDGSSLRLATRPLNKLDAEISASLKDQDQPVTQAKIPRISTASLIVTEVKRWTSHLDNQPMLRSNPLREDFSERMSQLVRDIDTRSGAS